MKCTQCGSTLRVAGHTHRYVESGLSNVFLHGVEVRKCSKCGEEEVAIPNVTGLHKCLAGMIVGRKSAMTREEFRFLRQFLGRSSQDFAKLIDVSAETVSRWQSGQHEIPRSVDLLVRVLVMRTEARIDYTDEIFEKMRPQPARAPRLALRLQGDNWQAEKAA